MNGVDYSAVLVEYIVLCALFGIALIAVTVFLAVVAWRLFEKLEYCGWLGIVPFVNLYILFKVTKMRKLFIPTLPLLFAAAVFAWALSLYPSPSLLLILVAVPTALALLLIWIRLALGLAYAFDKGVKFAVLTVIFPVIFIPCLALSKTKYFAKM